MFVVPFGATLKKSGFYLETNQFSDFQFFELADSGVLM